MIADSDQSAAVLLKEKLNAAERERDELRRERDEQIAEAASWRATARDKGSSSRAAAKERDELRAENERLQRLLDHATQSNPGTSVLVMLMNESREARAETERLREELEALKYPRAYIPPGDERARALSALMLSQAETEIRTLKAEVERLRAERDAFYEGQKGALAEFSRREIHQRAYNAAFDREIERGKTPAEAADIAGRVAYWDVKESEAKGTER